MIPEQQASVIEDQYFVVEQVAATSDPQRLVYIAMHQDYSEDPVCLHLDEIPASHAECGRRSVKGLLKGGRGHYGPLEHPSISFNCGAFPHSVMQQATRHRLLTYDVASFRYTGKRIVDAANRKRDIEEVYYARPSGNYTDRQGNKYFYSEEERMNDLIYSKANAERYMEKIGKGFAEEHARSQVLFDVRQHWIVTANLRALIHLLTIRGKADAQLEIQQMSRMMLPHFQIWAPEVYAWFEEKLWLKGRLAA